MGAYKSSKELHSRVLRCEFALPEIEGPKKRRQWQEQEGGVVDSRGRLAAI